MSYMKRLHLNMQETIDFLETETNPFWTVVEQSDLMTESGYLVTITTDWKVVTVLMMLVQNGQVCVAVQDDADFNWCNIYPADKINNEEVAFQVCNQLAA